MLCMESSAFFPHIPEIRSDQSLSRVRLFATPWITARQASLSITNSRSSLRLTSIESVMPSSHLILCRPLLLLPPIPPSIRVFSNESTLRMRWPKDWSFSFSIIPSKEIPGLISFRMDWEIERCKYSFSFGLLCLWGSFGLKVSTKTPRPHPYYCYSLRIMQDWHSAALVSQNLSSGP